MASIDLGFVNISNKGKKEFISLMRRSNLSIKLLISLLYASKDPLVLWFESVGKCVVTPLASCVF